MSGFHDRLIRLQPSDSPDSPDSLDPYDLSITETLVILRAQLEVLHSRIESLREHEIEMWAEYHRIVANTESG